MISITEGYSLLLALAIVIPLYYLLNPSFSKPSIPRVKGGKFLTGHTDEIFTNPVEFMKDCREKYGSLYSVIYLGKNFVVFGKEWIDELSKNNNLDFGDALNDIFLLNQILGDTEYIHHPKVNLPKIIRSMVTPFLKSYSARILDQVNEVHKEVFNGEESTKVELPAKFIRRMVVKASCSVMLGNRLSLDEEIIEAFYSFPLKVEYSSFSMLKYIKYPIIGRLYARHLINKQKVHLPYLKLFTDKVTKEIDLREKQSFLENYEKPNDLLQRLIEEKFSIDEISITCLTLIFASIMNTTNNSTMALYDMVTYPQHFNELYEEQLHVQKKFGDELNADNLAKMTKLNSFIRETMRFRLSGITNPRITTASWTLSNGITLPKGTYLGVDSFSIHYDDELQEGDPYEFRPFRHAANGKLATKIETQNISFGFGKHACPGRFLAIQEIMTILSLLLRNYKITTIDGKPHPYMVKPIFLDLPRGEPLLFTNLNS